MNDESQEKPPESTKTSPKDDTKVKKAKTPPIDAALAAYFREKPIHAGPFFKALRGTKLDRFTSDDLAAATALAAETDPTGARLLQLAAQTGKPKPVERWIWTAVQSFLRSKIPAAFEPFDPDADSTFRRIYRELQRKLAESEPQQRQHAEILLAMSLTWLASQRSLDVVATLEHLRDAFPSSEASTRETARKGIAEGKVGTLKRLAAVATLLGGALREARSTLDMERQRRAAVEAERDEAKAKIAGLAAQVETLMQELAKSDAHAAEAAKKLSEGLQHAGHDIVELKARQNAFLKRRITPLLNDAVDALEVEPPAPHIAIKRLKSAREAIGEKIE